MFRNVSSSRLKCIESQSGYRHVTKRRKVCRSLSLMAVICALGAWIPATTIADEANPQQRVKAPRAVEVAPVNLKPAGSSTHFNVFSDTPEPVVAANLIDELERALTYIELHTGRKMPQGVIVVHILSSPEFVRVYKSRRSNEDDTARRLAIYIALGLLNEDNADSVLNDVLETSSLGSYDWRDKVLRLRYDETFDVQTAVHELIHVLQDRITGIDKLTDDETRSEDALFAGLCITEGLAELATMQLFNYRKTGEAAPPLSHLRQLRLQIQERIAKTYRFQRASDSPEVTIELPEDPEALVKAELMLPYTFGTRYCVELALRNVEAGGSFEEVWSDLIEMKSFPAGTEEILDVIAANEQIFDLPSIAATGKDNQDYQVLEEGTQGEFLLKLWFGHPLNSRHEAFSWAGDRLILVHPKGTAQNKASGIFMVMFDTEKAAMAAEKWLTSPDHADIPFFARQVVTQTTRHQRLLCCQIGHPPEWLVRNAETLLKTYEQPAPRLTLRTLSQTLEQIIDAAQRRQQTGVKPLCRDLNHLASAPAAKILGDVLFESQSIPRESNLDGLIAVGTDFSSNSKNLPMEIRVILQRQAFAAICEGQSPVGMVNAVRFLTSTGLPDVPEAAQKLTQSAERLPPGLEDFKKVIQRLCTLTTRKDVSQ